MPYVVTEAHRERAVLFSEILATYSEAEDLINIGAYVKGSNPQIDHALQNISNLRAFLKQGMKEKSEYTETLRRLNEMIEEPLALE